MKKSKKLKLLALTVASVLTVGMAHAQSTGSQLTLPVGAGIASPKGTVHIHQTEEDEVIGGAVLDPFREVAGTYHNTFLMTNPQTGTRDTDGFAIVQYNQEVTLRQGEQADLKILGANGSGLTINKHGRMGIGGVPEGTNTLTVTGNSKFGNDITVGSKVTTPDLHVTNEAYVVGPLGVGNGFRVNSDGQVKAKEVRVTLEGWSDFVFEKGYLLPSLAELERYVKEHRHLPDIPSESEALNQGVELGQMNALLLQKVEELTLYIIDLQKQINELKNNNGK